ncbi:MAG: beta-N-acetylhexosaminidase [Hyphomicrobiales bacterium]|nr:beta-N-acetylhexosaminidase [Hyphomicrobiales bacterium]MCP5372702.1 beta-N-acetylhexosaminidase [Hyphomicrobiales bacterium]
MAAPSAKAPLAAVLGCAGPRLDGDERRFFRDADPLGFILFQRNCQDPDQVRALVADLRDAVGRADAPVLIDQEGGRVARLKPPHWRAAPPAADFCRLFKRDPDRGVEAMALNARLLAAELADLGITVDCAPVLDLPRPDGDPVIGDRACGDTPETAALLGRTQAEGLMAGGVLPVIKHVPGHGRATVDSHAALPVVRAPRSELEATDFAPFKALADMPWAMTAHVVYTAIDPDRPATLSPEVIADVIRGHMGFDGVLVSDDLSMGALSGGLGNRAGDCLAAGCDLALHCNGDRTEMAAVAAGCRPLDAAGLARVARGAARLPGAPAPFDRDAAARRLAALLEAA